MSIYSRVSKEQAAAVLAQLLADKIQLPVIATKYDWFTVIAALQLTSRHPHFSDSEVLKHAVKIAHRLQDGIAADNPPLMNFVQMGWDHINDVKRGGAS